MHRYLLLGLASILVLSACSDTDSSLSPGTISNDPTTTIVANEQDSALAPRVVGGHPIETPSWFVNMGTCGGTLIHPEWVLTAWHCENQVGKRYRIGGRETRRVVQWITLPDSWGRQVDLGLSKLDRPSGQTPAQINTDLTLDDPGRAVYAMGHGQTCDDCGPSRQLLSTGWFNIINGDAWEGSFTFGEPGRTICSGDSGGPVMSDTGVLVGVISYTEGLTCTHVAGAAKVSENVDWINSVIGEYSSTDSATPTAPTTSRIVGGNLVARHSSLCIDVAGGSYGNGADIVQWTCHSGTNQQFDMVPAPTSGYIIRARHSGLCLDVAFGSSARGGNVIQWPCHGGDSQIVHWNTNSGLVFKHSGLCLEVYGGDANRGATLKQWDCHGGENQQFIYYM